MLTSNLVLGELGNLLAQRVGFKQTTERISDIYRSRTFTVIQSTLADEMEAIGWMRKFSDQAVSFTDAVSFSIMRRLKIRTAFTFDRHFRTAGFHVIGLK